MKSRPRYEEAAISSIIQSPNIIFKEEGNAVKFISKQDDSITDIVFEVESTDGVTTYFHAHREQQLDEKEQRANRLEKQLEEERQRIRYLEGFGLGIEGKRSIRDEIAV